ncbi:acyltransferase family protein [Actinoplanes teichomyceticus]|uniref:Peptidoglycan/LPS O-acetylase OafA/YrhL n=1 Tax=Actinoplanes teichomyceticus TaxID=1867 RepID=A0A561WNF6_ACTTI|nr:acyltransferase family protein [Actinoplanes teichomyceticus]TWG25402.1 peptidoglycan/LPS O-acetylase OafA/YrhL [Actinoplanes teichomyceticus]GIF10469.1 acyltransferase [Actinoplanes teichomyceticus]
MSLSPTTPDRAGHRPDIEGLRAVAVLLVVLGHAGVPLAAGGYVGVDVFFVISGFLITSLLRREAAAGRLSIHRFYARRALRLLPAAALVLVATLVAARLWLPAIRLGELARDALSATGYVANLRFALTGTDYLDADAAPSPFQHFWSLAVEEQFYLAWPLLLLVARTRARTAGVLVAVVAGSFTAGVLESARSAPWAYFGPHTRAWELGAGALLAVLAPRLRGAWPGAAGLAAILVAAVWCDGRTPYPGVAALLPVGGAMAVLAGGCRPLAARPLRAVGRLSYGWYLWHWPVLLIGPAALGVDASPPLALLLAAAALGLSWVTYHLVENPLRRHPRLRRRPNRALGLGAGLSGAVAATAVTVALLPHPVPAGAAIRDLPVATARAADPYAVVARAVRAARDTRELPANLTPSLARVNADKARVWADGCHVEAPATAAPAGCVYGDPAGSTTVVLYGDSHAAHWFPALQRVAGRHRWRLVSLSKSSCSAADLRLWHDGLRREYTECARFHAGALARIRALRPGLVVIGSSFNYRPVDTRADESGQWRAAWQRTAAALRATGARVAIIADTPYLGGERVPVCLARQARLKRIDRCGRRVPAALRGPAQRRSLTGLTGVTVIDPVPWLCAGFCPPVIGNVLAYRDTNHLTTTYARTVAPLLDAALPEPE